MCDYCVLHGEGKRWYQNERNYSREIFSSDETQTFIHDFFSRQLEERKKRNTEILALSKTAEWLLTHEKLETYYRENLHHQVVPTEVACDIVRMADRACLMSCVCKKMVGKQDKLCLGLGFAADVADGYPEYTDGIQEISVGDACAFIERLDEGGVVHSVSALRVPYVGMVCNCDLKFCNPYRMRLRGVKNAFYKSEFVFEIDRNKCSQCGECVSRCLFGALRSEEEIFIDAEKCFGCGQCRRACEEHAIVAKERSTHAVGEIW